MFRCVFVSIGRYGLYINITFLFVEFNFYICIKADFGVYIIKVTMSLYRSNILLTIRD